MNEDYKPVVELWDHDGFGLIIDYPSGVLYSNQTGGTSCMSPSAEGVYAPLKNNVDPNSYKFTSPEIELFGYFEGPKHQGSGATDGLDEEDANFIDAVLERWELSDSLKVDRERLEESHEAWVYVTILSDENAFKGDESSEEDYAQQHKEIDAAEEAARLTALFRRHYSGVFYSFGPYPRAGILTWRNTD